MATDLYTQYFGFTERPFTLLPDPDFLYWSPSHMKAYTILEYGIAIRSPLTMVTGEVGAGKTTLVQKLLASIDDDVTIGLISNARGGRDDLLRWVLYALDIKVQPNDDYVEMFNRFMDFLVSEYAENRYVVLVIDEAQNLSIESLEELRMFTNVNSNKDELLQLILIGQPELRDTVMGPRLTQFAQRISATYHLRPLDLQATRSYIHHRLTHAGGTGDEFMPDAIDMIHTQTGGIPRLINKLCDLSLVYTVASDKENVDVNVVRELVEDGVFVKSESRDVLVLSHPVGDKSKKAAQ